MVNDPGRRPATVPHQLIEGRYNGPAARWDCPPHALCQWAAGGAGHAPERVGG